MKDNDINIIVTPELLKGSPNASVQKFESAQWIITLEDDEKKGSCLSQFLMDIIRNGLIFNENKYPGKYFKQFEYYKDDHLAFKTMLEKIFSDDDIERLDTGYSQLVNSLAMRLTYSGDAGILDSPISRVLKAGNWHADFFRKEGRLIQRTTFPFCYTTSDARAMIGELPAIITECIYSDKAKTNNGVEFKKASVPLIYVPLLFSNYEIDFAKWYELVTGNLVTFANLNKFRVSELILGSDRKIISLNAQELDTKSPIHEDLCNKFLSAIKAGEFRFKGILTPKIPDGPFNEEKKNILNKYFEKFFKQKPAEYSEDLKRFRAVIRCWNDICVSHKPKVLDIETSFDDNGNIQFEAATPYRFSQTEIVQSNIKYSNNSIENAWRADLTENEQKNVSDNLPTIGKDCFNDPRLILLFTKRTYINDEACRDWDYIYLPLKTADYKGLNEINNDLIAYREGALQLNNGNRQKSVSDLIKKIREELINPELPVFYSKNKSNLKKCLSGLESKLSDELNYLREVQLVREKSGLLISEFLTKSPQPVQVKQEENINIKQAIFNAYKEANYAFPSREELQQYTSVVTDTEGKLEKIENSIDLYLKHIHGIDKKSFRYSNEDGEINQDLFTIQQKKNPKIYSSILALGVIQKFRKHHGNINQVKEVSELPGLKDIEDYESIITVLRNILESNNSKKKWYQKNRFADGFEYKDENGNTKKAESIASVLEKKTESIFKEPSFSADLALELQAFEKKIYRHHTKVNSWFGIGETITNKQSVLQSAQDFSKRFVTHLKATFEKAKTIEELKTTADEHLKIFTPNTNFEKLSDKKKELHTAYAKNPKHRDIVKKYLEFILGINMLSLEAISRCEKAKSMEQLKLAKQFFEDYINSALLSSDPENKKAYQLAINEKKEKFILHYNAKLETFNNARLTYWKNLIDEVLKPAIEESQNSKTFQEIHEKLASALSKIDNVQLPENLASDDYLNLKEQLRLLLESSKIERIKNLLDDQLKQLIQDAITLVGKATSLDSLQWIKKNVQFNILQFVKISGLSQEKEVNELIASHYLKLVKAIKPKKSEIKAKIVDTMSADASETKQEVSNAKKENVVNYQLRSNKGDITTVRFDKQGVKKLIQAVKSTLFWENATKGPREEKQIEKPSKVITVK